ncbi:hypothetical protein ACQKWADRAFT_83175 [Trichoderma austrokoningii]
MPLFEPSWYISLKHVIWSRGVKNVKHSGIDIFKDYWEEFNTIRVPILGEDRFFEIALELEHMAKDEEDLRRLLLERRKLWEEEATKWLDTISSKLFHPGVDFLSEDASASAYRASRTGSLQHFLELLNGVVHGWAADEVEDEADDVPLTDSQIEAINYANKQPDYPEYYASLLDSENPPDYRPIFDGNSHKAPVFSSDTLPQFRQHLSKKKSDQEENSPNTPKDGSASSVKDPSRPGKRPRIDDEIGGRAHKRQKRELVAHTNTPIDPNSDTISIATGSTNTHTLDVTPSTSKDGNSKTCLAPAKDPESMMRLTAKRANVRRGSL